MQRSPFSTNPVSLARSRHGHFRTPFWIGLILSLAVAFAGLVPNALAQTVSGPYQNTSQSRINNTTTCNGSPLVRTIFVPAAQDFVIADLDVGFLATHSWRGDIQLDLESPSGTNVRLIESDTSNSGSANNVNVHMDDSAGTVIYTAPHNTNDGTSAPPYENLVSPHNALSTFDGEAAAGTWTLRICDDYPSADNGRFRRANLYFTALSGNDLSLTINSTTPSPDIGTSVTVDITIDQVGTVAATGISAQINLPSGLSYQSHIGDGSYNALSGLWTLPNPLFNDSQTISITAMVEASGSYSLSAELQSAAPVDNDSTPANGNVSEDDYDSFTFSPQTPLIPTLTCPIPNSPNLGPASQVNWDQHNWSAGSMGNSYTIGEDTITFSISDPDNTLLSDANFGGQTPALSNYDSGGLTPAQTSLHFLRNPPNRTSSTNITLLTGLPSIGVSKIQFSLFDVDFGNNQFQDRIAISASLDGNAVAISLTDSSANAASGNTVIGHQPANANQSSGNMTVKINSPVDQIVIEYGNHTNAPNNPGRQGIALHDISFCPLKRPIIDAQKTNAVYDPNNEGLYMVPGNDVIYTISFTNQGNGPTDTDSLLLIDAMPEEIEFFNGDMDDNGPLTDPVNIEDSNSGLSFTYAQDVRYFDGTTHPATFAACTYSPSNGYDPNIKYICINPKGALTSGNPDPGIAFSFRARIK